VKFIRTYEEFRFKDIEVLKPQTKEILVDKPVNDLLLGGDKGSYIDASGIIHIKNWNIY
jgi:hypothetical protein